MHLQVYPLSKWPDLYADWLNNFLTVDRFAEYYGISRGYANTIIMQGIFTDNFSTNE